MATGQQYSTLEVVNSNPIPKKPPPEDLGKQVVTENGIEAVDQPQQPFNSEKIPFHRRRKRLWIIASIVILVVILAAVLGGVLGSRKPKETDSNSSPSTTPSPSPIPKTQANLIQRKIAAISYPVNNANTTRLYYQDTNGTLVEGIQKSSSAEWNFTSIGNTNANCTALAAAVTRPGFTAMISVVFADNDFLIHDYNYNSSTKKWSPGTLSDQKLVIHPNSGLSVLYNQCSYCSNTTIVVYQDVNGFVQAVNHTASGWVQGQVNVKAIAGTGLALQPQYKANNKTGNYNYADQINLFYQQDAPALNISLASWRPAALNRGVDGWATKYQVYGPGFPGTPLAAAASNNNPSSEPDWIQLLQLTERGVGVNTWAHATASWSSPQVYTPSSMANSTANIRSYGAVAVTAFGNAFAVVRSPAQTGNVSVESWSMNDDLINWVSTGTVVRWNE